MSPEHKILIKRLAFIPPILAGIAIIVIARQSRTPPVQKPPGETARKVRVITVPSATVMPRALGYGNVRPGRVWEAISEVAGKVQHIHPQLKKGAILPKGTELLRIDTTDYQLALARIRADIRVLQAELTELGVRQVNFRASLEIERRSLVLNQRDLARKQDLAAKKAVSQAAVDQEERNLLARRQSIQGMQNTLNRMPWERQALNARIAALEAQLKSAERDLQRTTIRLPFDGRIARVNVEQAQYAKLGQVLAIADSIAVSEVEAQVPLEKMIRILDPSRLAGASVVSIGADLEKILGLTPVVRLSTGNFAARWPGRVARISDTVDPRTRTVGVIIAVDNPYRISEKNFRPPLTKNMFVEVELRGRPIEAQTILPRQAIHGGKIYLLDAQNRLRIRAVKTRLAQGGFVSVAAGVEPGQTIAISDLVPAIEGMLLDPVMDEKAVRALIAEAGGEASLR
jgi:multidrug efflux pump subunit AcrA (membrane-fusion protein)